MTILTKEDWIEIYNGLVLLHYTGKLGPKPDELRDQNIRNILTKIGPDGGNMVSACEYGTLTEEQVSEYVTSGGTCCPFCGDNKLEPGSRDSGDGYTTQWITCKSCGKKWQDFYEITNIFVRE